jgi:hypothetical protein
MNIRDGVLSLSLEAMEACASPLSLIRTIYRILKLKDYDRAHAAVGHDNLYIVLH